MISVRGRQDCSTTPILEHPPGLRNSRIAETLVGHWPTITAKTLDKFEGSVGILPARENAGTGLVES